MVIAPDVFRQRLLVELITKKKIDENFIREFLEKVVKELNLRVSAPPMTYESAGGKPINEGVEGFVPLIDSGITVNTWKQSGLVSIFIHTCKEFSEEEALNSIKNYFEPKEIEYKRI